MKKLTLAALVLGGFVVQAHAQSTVTVYGLIDLGLVKISDKTLIERENHPSRLGFRGVEELGGGLSATFNLESEILADTGAQKGNLFDRQANVGFKGAFGSVILGRTKNLVDGAQGRVEPFGADGVIGKINESMMRVGVSGSRVSNAITYNSPNVNGFVGAAQYIVSEVSGANAGIDLLATYDQGPVSVHVGWEKAVQTVATPAQPKMWVVGAGYKVGEAKISAAYAKGNTDVAATGKYTGYLLGLSYHLGEGDVRAVYSKQVQNTVLLSDKDMVKQFGLGYDYNLSKRTGLYAYVGRERVAHASSYQVGMTHRF